MFTCKYNQFFFLYQVTYAKTAKPEGIDILCENLNKCKNKIPKYGNLHSKYEILNIKYCILSYYKKLVAFDK